jgi:hypothetical protein
MGWLDRWDARNQRILEGHNERAKREGWPPDSPGPTWAYMLSLVPGVGVIGLIVIIVAGWRQRRARRSD